MFNASPNIHLKGYTALHIATEQGAAESVKTLLEFEADPEARTEPRQETPIHLASCQGKFESFSKKIQLLVDKGANIDAQNYECDTALHLAMCRIGTADAINILLKSGASTELKGRNERTPLQYAIFLDREEIAAVLLGHGANPNCVDENGLTPLHLAIRSSKISTEFLRRLIDAGANINKEDGNHHTPLYEAITQGANDAIILLLNHGAECKPHHQELERYLGQHGLWQKLARRLPWLSE
jgi:ankyrin repeat protein